MANIKDEGTLGTTTGTGATPGELTGSQRSPAGAAIGGGGARAGNEGPGPRVMSASTLEGDDIVKDRKSVV